VKALFDRIAWHAAHRASATALEDERATLGYAQLQRAVQDLAGDLAGERVGLLLDNGIAWAVCDLAVHHRGAVCVPLPVFFTDAQLAHVIADAGVDLVLTDRPARFSALEDCVPAGEVTVAGCTLFRYRRVVTGAAPLPPGTAKITYTSGTTGTPRGVCLDGEALVQVTESLCDAVRAGSGDRTLSLLPLSTLLENIANLYAPLWMGARAFLPGVSVPGAVGLNRLDARTLAQWLAHARPTSLVLVPALLKMLVESVAAGARLPAHLRLIAVGGAPVSATLLARARSLGLPVFQGYGLSEAASVVTLNRPAHDRPGSVGRVLAHSQVRIADDGEVLVRGTLFRGYVGECASPGPELSTGDLGYVDGDGYLFLTGRKKTAFATAYGRNVAPEWVESELAGHPAIVQAAVFGEGRPFNVAVLVANPAAVAQVPSAVAAANARLPDYARVRRWLLASAPFTADNGQARVAGVPDRAAIGAHYRERIHNLYEATLYEDNHARIVL